MELAAPAAAPKPESREIVPSLVVMLPARLRFPAPLRSPSANKVIGIAAPVAVETVLFTLRSLFVLTKMLPPVVNAFETVKLLRASDGTLPEILMLPVVVEI